MRKWWTPDHQLGLDQVGAADRLEVLEVVHEELNDASPDLLDRLADRGDARGAVDRRRRVVETCDRHIPAGAQPSGMDLGDHPGGEHVLHRDDRRWREDGVEEE